MKALLINFLGLFGSWNLIDLSANSALKSGIAPIIFTFFLISSLLWLIVQFGKDQRTGGGSYFGADASGFTGSVTGNDGGALGDSGASGDGGC